MVTETKQKNWFRRHWILTIILVFVVLGMIGSLFNTDLESNLTGGVIKEQTGEEEISVPNSQTQQTIYKIGETFIVDDVAFKINRVSTKSEVGSEYFGVGADGIFYIVDLTMENKAKESKTIFMEDFIIVDDQDRRFDYDTEAEIYYDVGGKDAIMFGEQLQPGLPITGVKIFDLPTTAKGLNLEIICCGFMSETEQVDLGV